NRSAAISSSTGVITSAGNYGGSRASIVQRRFTYGVAGFCRNGRPESPESVAGLLRNRWPESTGMGGRLGPESVAGFHRNTHQKADPNDVDVCILFDARVADGLQGAAAAEFRTSMDRDRARREHSLDLYLLPVYPFEDSRFLTTL